MGLPRAVLDRAGELLDREDRQLERTLAELNASRLALAREQSEAARARAESETTRDELRRKLEQLLARRDRLFESMRRDLDAAFQRAHGEVAAVIRGLQTGAARARDAARARERLLAIEAHAKEVQAGLAPEAAGPQVPAEAVDWRAARAGDRVLVRGGGPGVLVSLPDRRGRVAVQMGDAAPPRVQHVSVSAAAQAGEHAGGIERCDLRGQRVEDAIQRLAALLDRAALRGCTQLHVVHGLGTGALRDAVREHLASSPYVERFRSGHPDAGGEGVTEVELR
jgi:DNA mismatch repair protein MutS2